jgi:hypothetical protein
MADYNSQLPIRSKDDSDERVLTKIQDGADPAGVGKTMEVSETKAHVRTHGKDSDGTDRETLHSQEGHIQSNGDYDASTNKRPSSQGVIVSDRSSSPAETTMNKRPTAVVGNDDKVALDVSISDSQGNRIDENNPLATYLAESPAEEVDEYDAAANIAKDATANHDYTVTAAKDFKSIEAKGSSSGWAKFELQVETGVASGSFNTVDTQFNSTSNPNVELDYKKKVGAGIRVRVAKTNLDNQATDLYSKIKGLEI